MKDTPPKVKPFESLGFDYNEGRVSGGNAYGDCPFCGKRDKFYINIETGQWDCKAGGCQLRGNIYTFISEWHKMYLNEQDSEVFDSKWTELGHDRGLPVEALKASGVVFDGVTWYIPVRNATGALVNLRRYSKGQGLKGLPELDTNLFNADKLADQSNHGERVFICEGEWDAIALELLLEREGEAGVVIGVPGSSVWKTGWDDQLTGRDVVCCYDHDLAGEKGTKRVWTKVNPKSSSFKFIKWPDELPKGFDVRDFVTKGGTFEELVECLSDYEVEDSESTDNSPKPEERPLPELSKAKRPSFDKVMEVYKKHLNMTNDMETAVRIIFAVALSTQIPGDPLWLHIVSPPGGAKTELLLPLSGCSNCYFASTMTPHSLVSGFVTQGGNDPSLLPKLDGKTLIIKDFTEILNMPKTSKDELYGTLRGAYDGQVQKTYGNGVTRNYTVRFNIISGVTHAVFGERSASLGERFLIFHLVKGVGFDVAESIRAAIGNVGKENSIRHDLHAIVQQFVGVKVSQKDIPELPDEILRRIIALSALVGILRANVEKVYEGGSEKIRYRPQHELGTRLGKQLAKLAYGLALVNSPPSMGQREYDIVSRVALDTCVGLNLEAIAILVNTQGLYIEELCERLSMPHSTVRDQMDDLTMLGAIVRDKHANPSGRGAPRFLYKVSDTVRRHWIDAGLSGHAVPEVPKPPVEISRKGRKVKRAPVVTT